MEYKTDKRTKNLTLRDIHVGDWVQVWSETTERYSPPLKIIQICDDGTVYLIGSEEERPAPWEEDIKNVDALPITPELLKGFGFSIDMEIDDYVNESILLGSVKIAELWTFENCFEILSGRFHKYFHTFVYETVEEYPVLGELEWKGV